MTDGFAYPTGVRRGRQVLWTASGWILGVRLPTPRRGPVTPAPRLGIASPDLLLAVEPDSLSQQSSPTSSSVAPENVRHTVALIRECPRIGEGTPAMAFALLDRQRRTAAFLNVH